MSILMGFASSFVVPDAQLALTGITISVLVLETGTRGTEVEEAFTASPFLAPAGAPLIAPEVAVPLPLPAAGFEPALSGTPMPTMAAAVPKKLEEGVHAINTERN